MGRPAITPHMGVWIHSCDGGPVRKTFPAELEPADLARHVEATSLFLNRRPAQAWTWLCVLAQPLLRRLVPRHSRSFLLLLLVVADTRLALVPGDLMEETHLEAACIALNLVVLLPHHHRVFGYVGEVMDLPILAALSKAPAELGVRGQNV